MAKRQKKHPLTGRPIGGGSYRTANVFVDQIMRALEANKPGLYPTFVYIWRMTFGFNREWASLKIDTIAEAIGKSYAVAKRRLIWLDEHGFIERRERPITIGRNALKAMSYKYRIAPGITNALLHPDNVGEEGDERRFQYINWPPKVAEVLGVLVDDEADNDG